MNMEILKDTLKKIFDVVLGFKNRFGEKVLLADNASIQWCFLRVKTGNRIRVGVNSIVGARIAFSDIHLISLKSEFERLIVPSKFYGILAKVNL